MSKKKKNQEKKESPAIPFAVDDEFNNMVYDMVDDARLAASMAYVAAVDPELIELATSIAAVVVRMYAVHDKPGYRAGDVFDDCMRTLTNDIRYMIRRYGR